MTTPTLINLPPPPSNPDTPSDMGPGTPNSGTTSISALSTIAIKDGHRGHLSTHISSQEQQQSASTSTTNVLDAERADRISRLAGLERVATTRGGSGAGPPPTGAAVPQPPGYFDGANPPMIKERSTVGSASATGSVGGRTTWASSSDVNDADKMSEDHDDGISSTGALSDEANASLAGGVDESASTTSGPVFPAARVATRQGSTGSPTMTKGAPMPPYSVLTAAGSTEPRRDAPRLGGMTHDPDVFDPRTPSDPVSQDESVTPPAGASDRMIRERLDASERAARMMATPDVPPGEPRGLGKFYFEEK